MLEDPITGAKPVIGSSTSRRSFLAGVGVSLAYATLGRPAVLAGTAEQTEIPRTSMDRFSSVRGVNYYPSWTRSLPDLWMQYDREAVRFELSLARSLGFNSVRVWLGTDPWQKLGAEMWTKVSHFLDTSKQLGLSVLPVIFDSCGVETSDYTGEVVTLPEAYRRAMADPLATEGSRQRMRLLAAGLVESAGREAWCPYSRKDPSTILWQWHAPSPGYSLLVPEHWPTWERYLKEVLTKFGDHPAVLAWDLMNEPTCIRILNVSKGGELDFDPNVVYRFIGQMRKIADEIKPPQPITLGFESADGMRRTASHADLLSFHTYEASIPKLDEILRREKSFAAAESKSLLLTEAAAVLFLRGTQDTSDAAQVDLYRSTLPLLEQSGVGYYLVALMAGRFPFSWVGFYRPDGSRKPVADYIESVLKKAD